MRRAKRLSYSRSCSWHSNGPRRLPRRRRRNTTRRPLRRDVRENRAVWCRCGIGWPQSCIHGVSRCAQRPSEFGRVAWGRKRLVGETLCPPAVRASCGRSFCLQPSCECLRLRSVACFLTCLIWSVQRTELRATRKPWKSRRLSGDSLARNADRQCCGVMNQAPPRFTRCEPEACPVGSSCVELA